MEMNIFSGSAASVFSDLLTGFTLDLLQDMWRLWRGQYSVKGCPREDEEQQIQVGKTPLLLPKLYSSLCVSSLLSLSVSRFRVLLFSLFSSSLFSASCSHFSLFFLQPFNSGEQVSNSLDTAWGRRRQEGVMIGVTEKQKLEQRMRE